MLPFPFPAPGVLSVSELNRRVREVLEGNFPLLWVGGELSNFTRAPSGHWYFSLKDAGAQVRCVMFRHKNQFLDWQPREGMQVEVRALVTLYEPRGDFQLNVESMRRAGSGALFEAFERLKARLEAEGLFDAARRRSLPLFPRAIGIVTSPAAAALRDVLTTLARRMPGLPVIVYPTPVQGEGAALQIAHAIATAGRRRECDVLIVCRGGGSLEDLWPFNEEAVARAIAACPIPLVCGVGHETDFTIADFVADLRAPTPTAAAQLAAPDRGELAGRVAALWRRLHRVVSGRLENHMQHLDHLARRLVHPGERIAARIGHLGHLRVRLAQAMAGLVEARRWRLVHGARRLAAARPNLEARRKAQQHLAQRLDRAMEHRLETLSARLEALRTHLLHLNPQAVLERGYSIVSHHDGRIVRDSAALLPGETVRMQFARGRAAARITAKE